jgi:hypothetical protein
MDAHVGASDRDQPVEAGSPFMGVDETRLAEPAALGAWATYARGRLVERRGVVADQWN